jgi:Fe-S-cluster-containing hydrogenase component 2
MGSLPAHQSVQKVPARIVTPEKQMVYRAVRQLPLFDGIPSDELGDAIATGDLDITTLYRDDLVADQTSVARHGSRIYLVKTGQVALGVFAPEVLAEERRAAAELAALPLDERKKKVRTALPVIRLAEKNLASFGEGDLFNSVALTSQAGDARAAALFAVEPSELLILTPWRMSELTSRHEFFATRLRRAIEVARGRLGAISGVKQEIFDFFVRHGLSVAETLRVRQVDRCIECKECEKACEERYGHKRLAIHGPRLGMLDFVYACRTCTDQRCLDPCNYNAISFDAERHEVVIHESACTGCASCAQACPYGSIEMVDLEDPREKNLKIRLDETGALVWGEGTKRKAAVTKMASKCDHCATYGEQACISHCPTGALIEIRPMDVFRDGADLAKNAARAGFDHTVLFDPDAILPEQHFRKGLGISDFADAKVKRRILPRPLLWGVVLAAFFLATAEIVLRLWFPTLSLQYAVLRLEGLEAPVALLKVGYRPGDPLAVALGYVGTGLLVVATLYPFRKQVRLLQRLGSSAGWFDLHLLGGILGPAFITLHGVMKLDNWVSIAYWSMILVLLSGIIGRYLSAQVPELLHGRELDELDTEREVARLRGKHPDGLAIVDRRLAAHQARATWLAQHASLWTCFVWSLATDLGRPFAKPRMLWALRGTSVAFVDRLRLGRMVRDLEATMRRKVLVTRTQSILHSWKRVHVPFTFVLAAVAATHIFMALTYSM